MLHMIWIFGCLWALGNLVQVIEDHTRALREYHDREH